MTHPLNIAVLGVGGRMGRAILSVLNETPGLVLSGATASAKSELLGKPAGGERAAGTGVIVTSDAATAVRGAAVAIDFTLPEATSRNIAACVHARCPLVLGTTGHDRAALDSIASGAREIPIVHAPNMSLGVNLLLQLVEQAASVLDDGYDIEIFEAHHRNKKDAPSGTALGLGRAAAAGRKVALDDVAEHSRHGATGARQRGAIGFSVFRGGDVVGDHTVTFAGVGERIELTHRASDRLSFARGAVKAAQWLAGRPPGLYSMKDVLGLAGK
jgi:4-hydroxy-tetrahydrodipicolinate reductase